MIFCIEQNIGWALTGCELDHKPNHPNINQRARESTLPDLCYSSLFGFMKNADAENFTFSNENLKFLVHYEYITASQVPLPAVLN